MRTFLVSLLAACATCFALVSTSCSSTPADDPRPPYSKPDGSSQPCRVDAVPTSFTDVADTYEICTPVGCAGAVDCPTPTSGNATIDCYMPGGVTQCRLRCASGGITCPDGMVCVASADSGQSACAYPNTPDGGI